VPNPAPPRKMLASRPPLPCKARRFP